MKKSTWLEREDDWEVLMTFLPAGWQAKAKELGALHRCRVFDSAESLLRTLLIHLADGCSLRETAVRTKYEDIVSVSDVALVKRLNASGEWFRWMAVGVMQRWVEKQPGVIFGESLRNSAHRRLHHSRAGQHRLHVASALFNWLTLLAMC